MWLVGGGSQSRGRNEGKQGREWTVRTWGGQGRQVRRKQSLKDIERVRNMKCTWEIERMLTLPVYPRGVTHLCQQRGSVNTMWRGSAQSWGVSPWDEAMEMKLLDDLSVEIHDPLSWGSPSSTRLSQNKESFPPWIRASQVLLVPAITDGHGPIWPGKGELIATEKSDSVQLEQKPTTS